MELNISDVELKKFRAELGLSQDRFARRLGISMRTYQNYELGHKIPEHMKRLFMYEIFAHKNNINLNDTSVNIESQVALYKSKSGDIINNSNLNKAEEADAMFKLKANNELLESKVKMLTDENNRLISDNQWLKKLIEKS